MSRACLIFFLMIRRPPRSTLDRSSAASDVYKRQKLSESPSFGWGVEAAEGFTARLEQRLGVEVLDLAVCGYGTDQELLLWERDGRALQPDLVLLTVCENDLWEISRPAAYGRLKPFFTLRDGALVPGGAPPAGRAVSYTHLTLP